MKEITNNNIARIKNNHESWWEFRTRRIGAVAPPALGPDSGLIGPEWGGSVLMGA